MGLIDGLMGNATEVDAAKVEHELANVLVEGESVKRVYKLVRDLFVFTNRRLVLVDKQGLRGKKAEYLSIPYRSITRFSKETTGTFDMDAELKIWVSGDPEPIVKEFRRDKSIHDIYQLLGAATLS